MWNKLLRSLNIPNYRTYLFGQLISLHGTQLAAVAQAWLVYSITHSSLMLGLVHFTMLFPIFLLGLFSGVLIDQVPRRQLLFYSQGSAMLLSFLLAFLALSGEIELWHIFVIAGLTGVTLSVDLPLRQALLADLIPKEMLSNAVGLNSTAFNLSRFIGPALAGLLLLYWDEGVLFALNGASYILFLYIILRMQLTEKKARNRVAESKLQLLLTGLHYIWGQQMIRAILIHVGMVSMTATAFVVLMPLLADQRYGGGATTLGILLSSVGAGSLAGGLNLARKQNSEQQFARTIARSGVLASLLLLLFLQSQWLPLSMVILFLVGFSITTVVASTNAYLQTMVDDSMRGRLMSLYSVLFVGMAPLGGLSSGFAADWLGVEAGLLLFIVFGAMGSMLLMWKISKMNTPG